MIIVRQNNYCEKLYSTGDDYLDDLLEKAFCEGYECAQKEFGIISKFTNWYIDDLNRVNEEYEKLKPKSEKEIIEGVKNTIKTTGHKAKRVIETAGQKARDLFRRGQQKLIPVAVKVATRR